MKKFTVLFLMLLSVLILSVPVSGQEVRTLEMVIYTDDLDREVAVPRPLTSVVTLAPSLTETLYFLDAEELIKAVDFNSDFPETVSDLHKVTGWDMAVNYEMLLALEPELIFASEMTPLEEVSNMEKLGLTVYCVRNPEDFQDLFETILTIGGVIGKEDEAVSLVEELRQRVDAVTDAMKNCEEKTTVFYELDATDPTKPWTAGKETFISDIISISCGENLGDQLEGAWAQISLESLIEADPAVILLGDAAYGNSPEAVAARTGWGEISAVKNGKMFAFDDNLVSRPGPRLVEGLETIAEILHPEAFK